MPISSCFMSSGSRTNHVSRTDRSRLRKLESWQLDEAQALWRDFSDRKFQPFYRCAVDPARIEMDERVVRDLLGLGEDAVASVARQGATGLRPSIPVENPALARRQLRRTGNLPPHLAALPQRWQRGCKAG